MSLDKEIIKYGAKGAVLKYIKENAPQVPIELFILVPAKENWRDYQNQIKTLGECLVRSSSPIEDGKRLSFAGLFSSERFLGDCSVNRILNSVNSKDAIQYAKNHNVVIPREMGLIFQKKSNSDWNWGMLRHPHQENLIFVMGKPYPNPFLTSENLIYNEKTNMVQEIQDFNCSKLFKSEKSKFKEVSGDLEKVIKIYKTIESLPEFQNGFTYHMEFGTNPEISIYQFRPFRKKEQSSWRLNLKNLGKKYENSNISLFALCFGLTDESGIELTLARALSTVDSKEYIDFYKRKLAGKPRKEIIQKLLKKWKLSQLENSYAEEISKINPKISGHNKTIALDKAIRKINQKMDKEKTCLYQSNLHFYYGKDIDLIFPNAKMWIGEGGLEFLSHNWYRALQTYDISFLGYPSLKGKTGDKIKVFSDGVFGAIVEE